MVFPMVILFWVSFLLLGLFMLFIEFEFSTGFVSFNLFSGQQEFVLGIYSIPQMVSTSKVLTVYGSAFASGLRSSM